MQRFSHHISNLPEESLGVVVTVLSTGGSTPRKAGARMYVTKEGASTGTVGGGWIEHEAKSIAKTMIINGKDTIEKTFNLGGPKSNTPMICGGMVTLFFQII